MMIFAVQTSFVPSCGAQLGSQQKMDEKSIRAQLDVHVMKGQKHFVVYKNQFYGREKETNKTENRA